MWGSCLIHRVWCWLCNLHLSCEMLPIYKRARCCCHMPTPNVYPELWFRRRQSNSLVPPHKWGRPLWTFPPLGHIKRLLLTSLLRVNNSASTAWAFTGISFAIDAGTKFYKRRTSHFCTRQMAQSAHIAWRRPKLAVKMRFWIVVLDWS